MSLKVFYKGDWYVTDMPDDQKFFKLTREYYPNLKVKVGKRMIEIKHLKCECEERCGSFNKHHLKPGSRGGQTIDSNLIKMDISRHNAWHLLFQNLTLDEIIALLNRLKKIKKKQKVSFLQTG